MFRHSRLTVQSGEWSKFEYNSILNHEYQYSDVDRQVIYVRDDNAVMHLPKLNRGTDEKLLKIEGLKTKVVYSSGTTHALLIEANKDWYKMFRAVLTLEQQIQADCLGIEKLIAKAKVKYLLTQALILKLIKKNGRHARI